MKPTLLLLIVSALALLSGCTYNNDSKCPPSKIGDTYESCNHIYTYISGAIVCCSDAIKCYEEKGSCKIQVWADKPAEIIKLSKDCERFIGL